MEEAGFGWQFQEKRWKFIKGQQIDTAIKWVEESEEGKVRSGMDRFIVSISKSQVISFKYKTRYCVRGSSGQEKGE